MSLMESCYHILLIFKLNYIILILIDLLFKSTYGNLYQNFLFQVIILALYVTKKIISGLNYL